VYTLELIEETERHIKLFLAQFEKVDAHLRDDDALPKWVTCYNFLCLLNIPNMMRHFGPLRNMYEGSLGEKFLVLVKPRTHGIRAKWYTTVLRNIMQRKVLAMVRETVGTDSEKGILQKELDAMLFGNLEQLENALQEEEDKAGKKIWKTGKLGRHGSFSEVQELLHKGMPLSCLFLKKTKEFVVRVYAGKGRDGLHLLRAKGNVSRTRMGMVYREWEICGAEEVPIYESTDDAIGVHSHALFLPWLDVDARGKPILEGKHTCIDDDWMHLDNNLGMSLPNYKRWCS
jgi:hypothetical protein